MKRPTRLTIALLLVALALGLWGCPGTPPKIYVKDGKEYGRVEGAFRHNWWNYYERALSYMEGEYYEDALADLEAATDKRFADKRRARTYGLHFVDYFPHRERGVIYYLAGRYPEAQSELELSLSQQPSAKAQFYLDKVRQILLERTAPAVGTPEIALALAEETVWTREDPVTIAGHVTDAQYVSEIHLDGRPYFIDGARQRIDFSRPFRLDEGRHVIDIEAANLLGGVAKRQVVVEVDRQGPVLSLAAQPSANDARTVVEGSLFDRSGRIDLWVNGRSVSLPAGEDVPFRAALPAGDARVEILARDRLGNETRAEFDLDQLEAGGEPLLLAANAYLVVNDAEPMLLTFALGRKDTRKPTIKLVGWTDEQTVFMEKAYIEGDIRDDQSLADVTVNGESVLRRQGRMVFFNHLLNLEEGRNVVRIRAEDEAGNASEQVIHIDREVPRVFQLGSRFSFTLMPFTKKGLVTGLGDMYEAWFLTRLMDRNRFRLIERQQLEAVLREQKLSKTELVDEQTALRLGKLVAAEATMVGDFIETRLGVEVVARLIDNETSEILAVKDVYGEQRDRAALMDLAEGLSVKFHREFPLVDGHIVKEGGSDFYTDLGKDRIKPNRRLIVYRETNPIVHPKTGKVLGADTEVIGHALVTQVMENMCKAEVVGDLEVDGLTVEDKVITE